MYIDRAEPGPGQRVGADMALQVHLAALVSGLSLDAVTPMVRSTGTRFAPYWNSMSRHSDPPSGDAGTPTLTNRCQAGAKRRRSALDRGPADTADLQLMAAPARHRDEEQRKLLELPHPLPLCRVVTARTGPGCPGTEVPPLGSETEDEEHQPSVKRTGRPGARHVTGRFPGRTLLPECSAPIPRDRTDHLIRCTGALPPSRRR